MKRDAILFDLDGTLLPMDQDKFVQAYFKELTAKLGPFGYDKQHLTDSIWKGTYAMTKNNGEATNEERFWAAFSALLGSGVIKIRDEFEAFYRNEFNRARIETRDNPLAKKAVNLARKKADKVVLATNPVFPLCAVETRLSWIGLKISDFDHITTYENSSYCKPNPEYYYDIMRKTHASPQRALMIGNDLHEDALASSRIGIESFLVTDCLVSENGDISEIRNGTFLQMLHYLDSL